MLCFDAVDVLWPVLLDSVCEAVNERLLLKGVVFAPLFSL